MPRMSRRWSARRRLKCDRRRDGDREVQALVRALAAGRDVAEMGAAFGETAAFLAETARSVVTVERDPERAAAARERLAGLANVELLEGDVY